MILILVFIYIKVTNGIKKYQSIIKLSDTHWNIHIKPYTFHNMELYNVKNKSKIN